MELISDVRLPSVKTLLMISQGQTAIDAAENALVGINIPNERLEEAYSRMGNAIARIEAAWAVYEPLEHPPRGG